MAVSQTKNPQMYLMNVSCEKLVASDHLFRRVNKLIDLSGLEKEFSKLYSEFGCHGIPVSQAIRMVLVQYMVDYSDRQMEQALKENIAVKWFCQYELEDGTPDHSYLGKFRKRIGASGAAKIFNTVVQQIRSQGLVGDVFQFVDATAMITKGALWEERDRALQDKVEKFNNQVVSQYAADPQARFGCRGKDKFFFGYKKHVGADTRHGIITKVAVTPGNVPDGHALKHVLNPGTMTIADKAYGTKACVQTIKAKGCHDGTIKKQGTKAKNKDKDRFLSRLRCPFENLFSKTSKRTRYRGHAKVQFQAFMESVSHNLKRWVTVTTALQKIAPSMG
jgi:IS5 family transposase